MTNLRAVRSVLCAVAVLLTFAGGASAQFRLPATSSSGGTGSGSLITGCTSSILYTDASSLLKCDPAAVQNGSVSTAGRSILTIRDTTDGATQSFLNVAGTNNTVLTGTFNGANFALTGAGSSVQRLVGVNSTIAAGFTGASVQSAAGRFVNSTVSSGALTGIDGGGGSIGVVGYSNPAGSVVNIGGVFGAASGSGSSGGVWAMGNDYGIQAKLGNPASGTITNLFAAGVFDNGSAAANILIAANNGTPVFTIANGGGSTFTQPVTIPIGASGAPSLKDATGTNLGLYFRADAKVTVTANSVQNIEFDGSGAYLSSTGTVNFLSGALGNAADSGLRRVAANTVGCTLGGADNGWCQNSGGDLALNANYTNATTTFSNTALSAALVSGRTYSIDLALEMADSTAADGMKIDFNGGAATITVFNVNCFLTNDTTGATVNLTAATSAALATVINAGAMASTGNHLLRCSGLIVPSSSNTFILRAAQNAHTAGTLTILRGSWMILRDMRPL